MPAPTIRGVKSTVPAASATSITVALPPEKQVGDILEATATARADVDITTTTAGWVRIASARTIVGTDVSAVRYWKKCTALDEPDPVFELGLLVQATGAAIAIAGSDGPDTDANGALIASTNTSTSTGDPTWDCNAVTTQGPDRLLLASGHASADRTSTPPTGWTELVDVTGGTVGATTTICSNVQAAAGSTGTVSGTWSNAEENVAILVAYKPTASAAPQSVSLTEQPLPLTLQALSGAVAQITDDFNRADNSDLGAGWVEVIGDTQIVSNQVKMFGTTRCIVRRSEASFPAKQWSRITVTGKGTSTAHFTGPAVRCSGTSATDVKGYFVGWDGSTPGYRIRKIVNGTVTVVAQETTASAEPAFPYTLQIEVDGSTLRALVNTGSGFVEKVAATDSDIGTGNPGFHIGTDGPTADNFVSIPESTGPKAQAVDLGALSLPLSVQALT